ncbi:MAG: type IV pilus secretin PilQ [Deltaproteobacteria bacterium]|nr:type IV pilus secretin PilQ [Deltaproteobacteria bacterium]
MTNRSSGGWIPATLFVAALLVPGAPGWADTPSAPSVRAVDVVAGDTTSVCIQLDRSVEGLAVQSYLLSDPDRLVVEIPGGVQPTTEPLVSGLGGAVTAVRTDQTSDEAGTILTVTFDLSRASDHVLTVDGETVTVALLGRIESPVPPTEPVPEASERRLSGPALPPGAPPTVATLDFENLETVSRIVIGTNRTTDYTASQPEPGLIVVDLPGTTLASSLDRPLDTSQFLSPVRMVRAYATRSGTRVAIHLGRTADYSLRSGGENLLFVDVALPDDMRAGRAAGLQAWTAAAPSSPATSGGEGLKSAYQEEVLIGASGRSVDPQAAFGTGAGASDPAALFGMSAGFMYDTSTATALPYTGQRINMDLVNADIHSVFRLISHVSKLNLVSGDDVRGRITVRLENVPWDQALAAILQAKGLGSQRFGNIVRIAPIETIKAEQQAALEAQRASRELEPLQVYVVPLNYAQAGNLTEQVKSVLSDRGSIQVDSRSNQLIVQDSESTLAQVRELVRQLDRRNPSVVIEARIVEANSTYSRGLGIQWGGELNASASTGYATGAFFPSSVGISGGLTTAGAETFYSPGQSTLVADLSSPQGDTAALAMSLGSIPGLIDLDVRLSAMESEGWGKIVSCPRVTTMDNETARIRQGSRIPYLSTSAGGTQVRFIDAALELNVTPHITSDGQVHMQVLVTNNRADFSITVQGQPALQIKEAETTLIVADGDTTVIGGVFATEDTKSRANVPFLGRIPLLGFLFRNSGQVISRNELLVFLTPRIVEVTPPPALDVSGT